MFAVRDETELVIIFARTSLGKRALRKRCAKRIPTPLTHRSIGASVLIECSNPPGKLLVEPPVTVALFF